MTSKVILGHIGQLLCQNLSSTFVQILIEICMNANIMKKQFFLKIKYDLKCHVYILEKLFTLRPFDLVTSLTYVLMDNFCPCYHSAFILIKKRKKIETSEDYAHFFCQNNVPHSGVSTRICPL